MTQSTTPEPHAPDPHGHVGAEIEVPHLEPDETVPPRPEEELADALRSEPDAPRGEVGPAR